MKTFKIKSQTKAGIITVSVEEVTEVVIDENAIQSRLTFLRQQHDLITDEHNALCAELRQHANSLEIDISEDL